MGGDLDQFLRVAELRAALRAFERRTEAVARTAGLTPQRYLLLLMIKGATDGSERATVTAISERLCLTRHSVSELIKRAERLGLVEGERSPEDRRVRLLRLTAEGENRLARAFTGLDGERRRLRAALTVPSDRRDARARKGLDK